MPPLKILILIKVLGYPSTSAQLTVDTASRTKDPRGDPGETLGVEVKLGIEKYHEKKMVKS